MTVPAVKTGVARLSALAALCAAPGRTIAGRVEQNDGHLATEGGGWGHVREQEAQARKHSERNNGNTAAGEGRSRSRRCHRCAIPSGPWTARLAEDSAGAHRWDGPGDIPDVDRPRTALGCDVIEADEERRMA
jgi:hypothetical protein